MHNERWLLPEGIDEFLPPKAAQVESLRRRLLDLYQSWGYQLVMPPMLEYVDSLLTGTGADLDLKTFKLTDQVSGRSLGVRADMTPQVARIDAHKMQTDLPSRLCYIGTVLHTRPAVFGGTRNPLQVGAELFGHDGVASDVEILQLMLTTLRTAGIAELHIDLGHVGIYRGLIRQAGIDNADEMVLFDALQRKALPEIRALIERLVINAEMAEMFLALPSLSGDSTTIATAQTVLAGASTEVQTALADLDSIARLITAREPDVNVHIDLSELRAYQYQTGIVFAAFVPGSGAEIARGGRYNDIGRAFGRARAATGFSTDLGAMLEFGKVTETPAVSRVLAPWSEDAALLQLVAQLRNEGRVVIWQLPGQAGDQQTMHCDAVIRQDNAGWQVVKTG